MHIVIAPDSFKESADALQVANAVEKGMKTAFPTASFTKVPMADGGEGTVRAVVDATGGQVVSTDVTGPGGSVVTASYGVTGDGTTAVMEMAEAAGIHLTVREHRSPDTATTAGVGDMILDALDRGVRHFVVGIGGSATNDGGAGMLQRLGVSFQDSRGVELPHGGRALLALDRLDTSELDPRLEESRFRIACDVDNPLCGPNGASVVYGPQKGAEEEMITELDRALAQFAAVGEAHGLPDVRYVPGSGAAGGLGAGFLMFLPSSLERGAVIVAEETGLAEQLQHADIVVTGEGGMNHQTVNGKTPVYVAQLSRQVNPDAPVIALCGSISDGYEGVFDEGIDAVFSSLREPASLDELPARAEGDIELAAANIARMLRLSFSS
ncbi:glycerate kinase [Alkalicoccus chagannorensis]|uniref:glycerate kinase family protein n=1 Tax=Alkalicoccus chagannorensis TaxID=427072 RepID=UPI00047901C7|nr:glycerate kinase [Alkalicoccus chagannorensis]